MQNLKKRFVLVNNTIILKWIMSLSAAQGWVTNQQYTITFTAINVDNDQISWKIYDGYNFNTIDWTVENGELILEGAGKSSAKINDVNTGDEITISVNSLTKEVNVIINNGYNVDGD